MVSQKSMSDKGIEINEIIEKWILCHFIHYSYIGLKIWFCLKIAILKISTDREYTTAVLCFLSDRYV